VIVGVNGDFFANNEPDDWLNARTMRGGRVDKEKQPPLHLPTQGNPQQIQDRQFTGNNNKILSRRENDP